MTEPGGRAVGDEALRTRVVVVAGGGGAKAAALIGAMRALAETGLRPAHFVGTSMGAVLSATFAAGLSPGEVLERLTAVATGEVVKADPFAFLRGLWARSVLKPEPLRAALERLVPARRFEDLAFPLTVTAAAVDTGELALFGAAGRPAPLLEALYATCALPVFFPPGLIAGRRYADGGLRSVLPLEAAAGLGPTLVVAVDVGPGFDDAPPVGGPGLPALVDAHNEGSRILMAGQTAQALALWRATPGRPPLIYIRPRAERGGTFRVDQVHRYVEEGYVAARAALVGLKSGEG